MIKKNHTFCLVKTPMRISLSGGGTDFPGLFPKIKFGSVLSFAINSYVYTSVRLLDPTFHKNFRVEYSRVELTKEVSNIKNNIVRGVLLKLDWDKIVQVNVISDIPGGSGLGGSSVFCVSLVHALQHLQNQDTSPSYLAEIANEIEINVLGRSMGVQDALPAAHGGLTHYRLHSLQEVEVSNLNNPILTKYISENIYLIWTGEHRESESILEGQVGSLDSHIHSYEILKNLTESVVTKLRKEKNIKIIHKLLEETIRACHEIKITIANGIVSNYARIILNSLEELGIIGYRVVGAGNGGFILALVESEKKEFFKNKFKNYIVINPKISEHGSHVQFCN